MNPQDGLFFVYFLFSIYLWMLDQGLCLFIDFSSLISLKNITWNFMLFPPKISPTIKSQAMVPKLLTCDFQNGIMANYKVDYMCRSSWILE